MERYNTKILKKDNGPRYYSSVKYPFIEPYVEDYYIITVQGDRLDNLAYQFYKDSTLYWIFLVANNLPKDSLYPPTGIQLRVPQNLTKIIQDFENLNN